MTNHQSKIEKLIAELCPNGVEFKELGELGDFYGGLTGKSKDDFSDGNAKFITYMNIFSNIAVDTDVNIFVKIKPNEKQNKIEYGDVLFTGSSETPDECGMSSVLTKKIDESLYLNSFCFGFRFNDISLVLPEFSKYLFRDEQIRKQIANTASGVTRFNVSKKRFSKIKIPLPPLAIQEEIVKILDSFTELETELEAELEARKKQYEYYHKDLFDFKNDFEIKTLGDIYDFQYGEGNTIPTTGGEFPVYGSNGIVGSHDKYNSEDAPVIGHIGAYAGIVNWAQGKHFVTYNGVICKIKPDVNHRFGYHLLVLQDFRSKANAGSQPFVSYDMLKKTQIKIPNISMQNKIADTLDKFDALVNDLPAPSADGWRQAGISIGLPAELKARRQQYEYYRGKLLTFKENPQ